MRYTKSMSAQTTRMGGYNKYEWNRAITITISRISGITSVISHLSPVIVFKDRHGKRNPYKELANSSHHISRRPTYSESEW